MLAYFLRRSGQAIPNLLVLSFAIFAIVDAAPGGQPFPPGPTTANEQCHLHLQRGAHLSLAGRYADWAIPFFVNEPIYAFEQGTSLEIGSFRRSNPVEHTGMSCCHAFPKLCPQQVSLQELARG